MYGVPTLGQARCPSRCPWGAQPAPLFLTAGLVAFLCPLLTCFPSVWLWLFFPLWPLAESYCTSEASARTLTSAWSWLPVRAGQCVRTAGMWSGLARGDQRRLLGSWTYPWVRAGSLFPGGQDRVCFGCTFFFSYGRCVWERERERKRETSRSFDPSYL